jgi:hypothetical protein
MAIEMASHTPRARLQLGLTWVAHWPGRLTEGTAEALKWLALSLMVGDHVNRYVLQGSQPWLYDAGRLAMPLFASILGVHLARDSSPSTRQRRYRRVALRLAVAGTAATLPLASLGALLWGWYPLNVLFTLLFATGLMALLDTPTVAARCGATSVFIISGAFVEFWWPGLATSMAAWFLARRPSGGRLLMWLCALLSLTYVNGTPWALGAAPLFMAASGLKIRLRRLPYIFYSLYPLHLAALSMLTA